MASSSNSARPRLRVSGSSRGRSWRRAPPAHRLDFARRSALAPAPCSMAKPMTSSFPVFRRKAASIGRPGQRPLQPKRRRLQPARTPPFERSGGPERAAQQFLNAGLVVVRDEDQDAHAEAAVRLQVGEEPLLTAPGALGVLLLVRKSDGSMRQAGFRASSRESPGRMFRRSGRRGKPIGSVPVETIGRPSSGNPSPLGAFPWP